MKIIEKLASFFGCSRKREGNMVWALILKRKADCTSENDVPETYLCGTLFGTEYEAMRHKESLEKDDALVGFEVVDVCQIYTYADITVGKYNYNITPEHPKITMTYEYM